MPSPPLILATKNAAKAAELAALLAAGGWGEAISLAAWEAGSGRLALPPEESGRTLAANALIKARAYARATGSAVLADDSGLSVSALGGAPGVHSARFGGRGLSDGERCRRLLGLMRARRDRRAFFGAVLALARPDGGSLTWRGRLEGFMARDLIGEKGFGYDAVFRPRGASLTLGEMPPAAKNALSHRARAIRAFLADADLVRDFLASG